VLVRRHIVQLLTAFIASIRMTCARSFIDESDIDWLVELVVNDLIRDNARDPAVHRAYAIDVIGALITRGISAKALRTFILAHPEYDDE
jgi:hypothetical protein